MNVKLRNFPYPYQAALAICSDIDGTNFKNFIEIHKFLNTNQNTLLGPGLKLPIGDSFWMYDNPKIVDHAFSYFKDLQGNISSAAPIIRDFVKAGILDVMHSYGNFAAVEDFSRRIAIQAIEELEKQGLKISVWTNHGGIESVQNIGQKSPGKGDVKNNDFYHSDLLINYGILFYWDAESSLMTNVGQDCPAKFGDAYWRSPLYQGWRNRTKSTIKGIMPLIDKSFSLITKKHFLLWEAFDNKQNNLISINILRDYNKIYQFKRFGLGRFDWSDDLPVLLNKQVLKKLINSNSYLILYIHLGDRRTVQDNLPLSKQTIATLKHIAELYHNGTLWVTTASRLLKYNLLMKTLDWTVKENSQSMQIFINGISSPLKSYDLIEDDLAGLTFYVPDNKNPELIFKDRLINVQKNTADKQGQRSVTIPLLKIEWPL